MRFEFVPIFFYERCGRHGGGIAKGTDRITHDIAADVENEIHIAFIALPVLDAPEDLFHPVTTFAARAALAARFVSIET